VGRDETTDRIIGLQPDYILYFKFKKAKKHHFYVPSLLSHKAIDHKVNEFKGEGDMKAAVKAYFNKS